MQYKTSPDSIHLLLQKAHAINSINNENLDFIQSRKGQKVVTKHKYSIKTLYDMFTFHKSTKNIDNIISSWKYSSCEVLTKEKIAIDDFIDRTLVGYDDLVWLHREYDRLLNQYARLLADEPKSRLAVEGVLLNVEVLQLAIGKINVQTLYIQDSEKANEAMTLLMKYLSKVFDSFQSKTSGIEFNFQSKIVEKPKQGRKKCRQYFETFVYLFSIPSS